MKDPIALMSAQWLAGAFDADVIVLIRHPAAFVSSLLRLDWTFPFKDLLGQRRLMETLLTPYAAEIQHYAESDQSIIDQACLLWKIFHHVIYHYKTQHPNWKVVRMEDLASDPVAKFGRLYTHVGLEYTSYCKSVVQAHSLPSNPGEVSTDQAGATKRDSRAVIRRWKKRLSNSQIQQICRLTADVPNIFYGEEDW